MTTMPEPMHSTVAAIVEWYAAKVAKQEPREYLGCSSLGHACQRYPALQFRLAPSRPIDGTLARRFDTGHVEEARLIADMRAVGITVWDRDEHGNQWGVQALGGHLRGHLDAVIQGLPEAHRTPHVWDGKTAKADKFRAVQKHGIRKVFPQYYAQGQLYMGLMELERAAFLFVNKDTDELHLERFEFDPIEYRRLLDLAERIVFSDGLPPKAGDKPEDTPCRWCDFKDICWGEQTVPASCRTCAHSSPERDGTWSCGKHRKALDFKTQRKGCGDHRYVPIYLANFADAIDSDGDAVTYRHRETGNVFVNGPRPGLASKEIAACAGKAALGDPEVNKWIEEFDGTIVG